MRGWIVYDFLSLLIDPPSMNRCNLTLAGRMVTYSALYVLTSSKSLERSKLLTAIETGHYEFEHQMVTQLLDALTILADGTPISDVNYPVHPIFRYCDVGASIISMARMDIALRHAANNIAFSQALGTSAVDYTMCKVGVPDSAVFLSGDLPLIILGTAACLITMAGSLYTVYMLVRISSCFGGALAYSWTRDSLIWAAKLGCVSRWIDESNACAEDGNVVTVLIEERVVALGDTAAHSRVGHIQFDVPDKVVPLVPGRVYCGAGWP